MSDVLIGIAGTVIVMVVVTDIFRSLLVPRANARLLRLGPVLTQFLFPIWYLAADRIGNSDVRQTVRASLAPLMLVLSLIVWAAMLIAGYGLLFWADRAHFSPHFFRPGDAMFSAGSTFATLGGPRIVEGVLGNCVVMACALSGLALVTVVATFLISIQSAFRRREVPVLRLEAHVTLPPTGIAILETYADEDVVSRLGKFFDEWEEWAADVAISHRAFPTLMFFRSNDARCEWLAALGAVLDAAALLDATVADAPAGARAGAHFVLRTGSRLVRDMAPQVIKTRSNRRDPADAARFRRERERLVRAGYVLVEDEDAALSMFRDLRRDFASALGDIAERLRISVDDHAVDARCQ